MCRFDPSLPRSVGFGPVSYTGRIEARPFPINLVMLTQLAKHRQMQLFPHACGLPIPQPSPLTFINDYRLRSLRVDNVKLPALPSCDSLLHCLPSENRLSP